ncbi:MAG: hypothetical protein ACQERS_13880 [Bacteroidota bacterium]
MGTIIYDPQPGTIEVSLSNRWRLQDTKEAVKIQGYYKLPLTTPLPEVFNTYKGTETSVGVDNYRYTAIHLEVKHG